MLNRVLKTKLPYTFSESDLLENYNFIAKSVNQELDGEKNQIISSLDNLPAALEKMIKSLNGRNILKKKLKYTDDYKDSLNFAVNVLNSSVR